MLAASVLSRRKQTTTVNQQEFQNIIINNFTSKQKRIEREKNDPKLS